MCDVLNVLKYEVRKMIIANDNFVLSKFEFNTIY